MFNNIILSCKVISVMQQASECEVKIHKHNPTVSDDICPTDSSIWFWFSDLDKYHLFVVFMCDLVKLIHNP